MDGREYLSQVLEGRLRQLSSFSARMRRAELNRNPLLSAPVLGRQAVASIILGIGHGISEDPNFEVEGFGIFAPSPHEGMEVIPVPHIADSLKLKRLWIDPVLKETVGGEIYWRECLARRTVVDTEVVQGIMADAFNAKFGKDGDFVFPVDAAKYGADLSLRAFFDSIVNALVLDRQVSLSGLGDFSYDSRSNQVVLAADGRILDAVRLFHLRQRPLRERKVVGGYTVGPLPDEPELDHDALVGELERNLATKDVPEGMLEWSARMFRKTLIPLQKKHQQ